MGVTGLTGVVGPIGYTGYNSLVMGPTGSSAALTLIDQLIDCISNSTNKNLAMGINSLSNLTSGIDNTVVGSRSLPINTTGSENTVVGNNSMSSNISGSGNTVIGHNSLINSSSCNNNTVLGNDALKYLTVGNNNTVAGYMAATLKSDNNNLTNVSNSMYIGCRTKASNDGVTNENVIGYSAVGQGSNTFTLGNTSITSFYAGTDTLTSISDVRDKENIQEIDDAINIIEQIKPIVYEWNPRDISCTKKGKECGFSAQNLLYVQNNNNQYLDIVDDHDINNLKIKRDNLIPIILKCIKELSNEYDLLEKKLI